MAACDSLDDQNVDLQLSQFIRSVKRERKRHWTSLFAKYEALENNFEEPTVSHSPTSRYIDGTPTRLQKLVEFGEKLRPKERSPRVNKSSSESKSPLQISARESGGVDQEVAPTPASPCQNLTPSQMSSSCKGTRARSVEKPTSITPTATLTPVVREVNRRRALATCECVMCTPAPRSTSSPSDRPQTTPQTSRTSIGRCANSAKDSLIGISPNVPVTPVIRRTGQKRVSILSRFHDSDEEAEVSLIH